MQHTVLSVLLLFSISLAVFCACEQDEVKSASNIHMAAIQGDVKVLQDALNCGEDVNSKMQDGSCPIHLAAWKSNKEVVQLLLDNGADIECTTNAGQTALHKAVKSGDASLAQYLLGKYIDE